MKAIKIIFAFLLALVVTSFAPANKGTEVIKDFVYVDDVGFDVPCGNNGLGMHLSGICYEHIVNHYDAEGHCTRCQYTMHGSVYTGTYNGEVVEKFTLTGAGKWEGDDIFNPDLPLRIVETDVLIGDHGTKIVLRPYMDDGVYIFRFVNCLN